SDRRAYAYLLVPARQALTPVARRRLKALQEFSELGSGFRIAAMDLEIRRAEPPGGGAERAHRGGRVRDVLPPAGPDDPRDEGGGPAPRDPGADQPGRGHQDPRGVDPRLQR